MTKRFLAYLTLAACCFLLCGRLSQTPHRRPVVTSIEITCAHHGKLRHFYLYDDRKMGMVLGYLRAADNPFGIHSVSCSAGDPVYTMRVFLSNGKSHIYRQLGNQYLQKDCGPWKILDPDQGDKLTKMEKTAFSRYV